jgi:hypothetical protein
LLDLGVSLPDIMRHAEAQEPIDTTARKVESAVESTDASPLETQPDESAAPEAAPAEPAKTPTVDDAF